MSTDLVSEGEFLRRAKEEIEKKHRKSTEELYEERERRVMDAIGMREPDRVPVSVYLDYFPIFYVGASPSAVFYDLPLYTRAVIKTLTDFEPDLHRLAILGNPVSGRALEILDPKTFRWPGGNVPSDYGHQFAETEAMKAEEYEFFMMDPTDFLLRYYLPRVCGALEPLAKMPPLGLRLTGNGQQFLGLVPTLASPEFLKLAATIEKMALEPTNRGWQTAFRELGFPPIDYRENYSVGAPFDSIAHHLRGFRGVMLDMFQRPETLIAACEKILQLRLARMIQPDPHGKYYHRRVIGGATHYTSDSFITKKQFERFCWPTWKKWLLSAIDAGWIPGIFFEGKCDDRVEYLLELPRGKFYARFEQVDMSRVKSILGDHCCICGNVPASLLAAGSVQEVEDYCQNLIDVCGKRGGFILETASSVEAAKPANLKAMIASVDKFGRY